MRLLAANLLSAVGVDVAANGDVYVSELFKGQISRIKKGSDTAKPYLTTTLPGAVEWTKKGVYATTNVLSGLSGLSGDEGDAPAGKVVRIG